MTAGSTPKDKIRVGLIGSGGISKSHLPHLSTSPDVEIAAFCDIVVERAQNRANEYGGSVYDDAEKMLAKEKLDAAYILIPTYKHGAPERACIAAGVPFLVEKPLGIDPDDLRKLNTEVQASGLIAMSGFMNRYRKSVQRVKSILADDPAIIMDGAWIGGPPLDKDGDYFAKNPIGEWWPVKDLSGGQYVEQVVHTIDLARYLGGEVEEVYAFAARGFNKKLPQLVSNYTNDDAMVVSLKFAHGGVGNLMASCSTPAGGGIFLNIWAGQHGAKFTDWAHHVEIYTAGQKEPETIKGDIDDIFPTEDRVFIDAVKTGDRSKIKAFYEDGARTTLLALAANESIRTGQPVKVKYE